MTAIFMPNTLSRIPLRMAPFVQRLANEEKVVVTRKRVNRGAGLEIPCTYIYSGNKNMSISKLVEVEA